jgi:hypothetical protein
LWIGWATTGTLAVGALATGIEALSANTSLSHAKSDGPASADTLNGLSSRARGFAIASDVMTGATVVAGGVTLYFTLRKAPKHAPARAGMGVELGVGKVSVAGSF